MDTNAWQGTRRYALSPAPLTRSGRAQKRKIMARPVKTLDSQRTKTVKFRVTEAEIMELEKLASDAGLTLSDFLRGLALNTKPRSPKATPDRIALIKSLGTLGNIRADINQVLKDRQHHKFVEPERVETVFTAIETIAYRIHEELEQ